MIFINFSKVLLLIQTNGEGYSFNYGMSRSSRHEKEQNGVSQASQGRPQGFLNYKWTPPNPNKVI